MTLAHNLARLVRLRWTIVSPSEAIAPFHVVVIGARYCAVTDAICGTWTKRDSAMTYAT